MTVANKNNPQPTNKDKKVEELIEKIMRNDGLGIHSLHDYEKVLLADIVLKDQPTDSLSLRIKNEPRTFLSPLDIQQLAIDAKYTR